jgi:hypothetical protein
MAKTKNITKKSALLHRNMKQEIKKEIQTEINSWADITKEKEKERILRQSYSCVLSEYKY